MKLTICLKKIEVSSTESLKVDHYIAQKSLILWWQDVS